MVFNTLKVQVVLYVSPGNDSITTVCTERVPQDAVLSLHCYEACKLVLGIYLRFSGTRQ